MATSRFIKITNANIQIYNIITCVIYRILQENIICSKKTPLLSSPFLSFSHLSSPHLTSPHLTSSPLLSSPHLTSPHLLTSSLLTSPILSSTGLRSSSSIFIPRSSFIVGTRESDRRAMWHKGINIDENDPKPVNDGLNDPKPVNDGLGN